MQISLMKVFYGTDSLPYKDVERTVHYPIVGNAFMGASNTTKIRFYVDRIGGSAFQWVVIGKLPNGKRIFTPIESSSQEDNELGENYIEFSLTSAFTQCKGDLMLSLGGYTGMQELEDGVILEMEGNPVIEKTGAIKVNIAYSTQIAGGDNEEIQTWLEFLSVLGTKANKDKVIITYQTFAAMNSDLENYDTTQYFFCEETKTIYKLDSGVMYVVTTFDRIGLIKRSGAFSNSSGLSASQLIEAKKQYCLMLYTAVSPREMYIKVSGVSSSETETTIKFVKLDDLVELNNETKTWQRKYKAYTFNASNGSLISLVETTINSYTKDGVDEKFAKLSGGNTFNGNQTINGYLDVNGEAYFNKGFRSLGDITSVTIASFKSNYGDGIYFVTISNVDMLMLFKAQATHSGYYGLNVSIVTRGGIIAKCNQEVLGTYTFSILYNSGSYLKSIYLNKETANTETMNGSLKIKKGIKAYANSSDSIAYNTTLAQLDALGEGFYFTTLLTASPTVVIYNKWQGNSFITFIKEGVIKKFKGLYSSNSDKTLQTLFSEATAYVSYDEVGSANGVASLDANGKIPDTQLPQSVITGLKYGGSLYIASTSDTGDFYGGYYLEDVGFFALSETALDLLGLTGSNEITVNGITISGNGLASYTDVREKIFDIGEKAIGLFFNVGRRKVTSGYIAIGSSEITNKNLYMTGSPDYVYISSVSTNDKLVVNTLGEEPRIGYDKWDYTDSVISVNGKTGAVTLTKSDIGLGNVLNVEQIPASEKGANSGVATLDSNGKVPSSQLPSFIAGLNYGGNLYVFDSDTTKTSFNLYDSGVLEVTDDFASNTGLTPVHSITANGITATGSPGRFVKFSDYFELEISLKKNYFFKVIEQKTASGYISNNLSALNNVTFYFRTPNSQSYILSTNVSTRDWVVNSTGTYLDVIDNSDVVTGVKGSAEQNYRYGNVNISPEDLGLGHIQDDIADEYENTETYTVGEYVLYEGLLYRCTTAVSTPEDFDNTKWASTTVADELMTKPSLTDDNTWSGRNIFKTGNASYGLSLPDTTNWTADKEVGLAEGTFNVINASDIENNTLTQAQYDLITNGKPTLIKGTYSERDNQIWITTKKIDNTLTILSLGSRNQYDQTYITQFLVNSNKVVSLNNNESIFMNGSLGMYLYKVYQINGKVIPSYPSSPAIPQSFNYLTNNTLAYEKVTKYNSIYEYATNSTTQLEFEIINNISVNANTTFTLATAPANTYPEYKANITNTDNANAITITLPSGTIIKGNVTISSNTFEIPADSSVELNIQNGKALVMNWGA